MLRFSQRGLKCADEKIKSDLLGRVLRVLQSYPLFLVFHRRLKRILRLLLSSLRFLLGLVSVLGIRALDFVPLRGNVIGSVLGLGKVGLRNNIPNHEKRTPRIVRGVLVPENVIHDLRRGDLCPVPSSRS